MWSMKWRGYWNCPNSQWIHFFLLGILGIIDFDELDRPLGNNKRMFLGNELLKMVNCPPKDDLIGEKSLSLQDK